MTTTPTVTSGSPWQRTLTLGQRLRMARVAVDLSREQAAGLCGKGCSPRTWARWEDDSDDRVPNVRQIRLIAEKLDVDPTWLAFGDGSGRTSWSDACAGEVLVAA